MRQDSGSRLPAPRPRLLIPEPKVKNVTGGGEGSPPPRPHRRIREGEEMQEENPKSGENNNWTGNWSNPLDRMNDEREGDDSKTIIIAVVYQIARGDRASFP